MLAKLSRYTVFTQTYKENYYYPNLTYSHRQDLDSYQQSGTNKICLIYVSNLRPSKQAKDLHDGGGALLLSSDLIFKPGEVFTTDRQWSSIITFATRARCLPVRGAPTP